MISIRDLPAINATLNGTAAVLLVWGYILIRRRSIAALSTSTVVWLL